MGQAIFANVRVTVCRITVCLAIAAVGSKVSFIPKVAEATVITAERGALTNAERRSQQTAQYPALGSDLMVNPDLTAANTRFSFKIFSEVIRQNGVGNVTLSPTSVAIALSMTYNGATGETQRAMAQTLELQGMSLAEVNQAHSTLQRTLEAADPEVQLAIANSLWSREGIRLNADFLRRNQEFYHAEIASLNFGSSNALSTINGWVSRNTQGRIPQILGRIDQDAVLFLINAIYFKGNWTNAFDRSATTERPFYLPNGTPKQHPLMTQRGSYFYLETPQFQAINLPYGNERFSMYVFLPNRESNLSTFLQSLSAAHWTEWSYEFSSRNGSIQLPRFQLDYAIELSDVLKATGMANAFDPSRANFSGLSSQPTSISFVQHKTFIEVNEEGTEAAAATAVGISRSAAPTQPPFQMVIDRPFFYVIQDNETGEILFMGTVVDPQI